MLRPWSANQLVVVLALWADANLAGKGNSISIKLVSRWKHGLLKNLLVHGCSSCGPTPTDGMAPLNHHQHWTSIYLDSDTPDSFKLRYLNSGLNSTSPAQGWLVTKNSRVVAHIQETCLSWGTGSSLALLLVKLSNQLCFKAVSLPLSMHMVA